MEIASGAGPDAWHGRKEFISPDELIVLSIDYGDEDFHIDARPGYSPADMRIVLAQARARGLEPLDAAECEPEILEDDTVRVYLALAEQPAVTEQPVAVNLQETRRHSAAKRVTLAFALATSVAVALLLPSPLRYIPGHQASTVEYHSPTRHAGTITASTKED